MKKLIFSFAIFTALSGACFNRESKAVSADGVITGLGVAGTALIAAIFYSSYNILQTKYKNDTQEAKDGRKRVMFHMKILAGLGGVMGSLTYRLYTKLPAIQK